MSLFGIAILISGFLWRYTNRTVAIATALHLFTGTMQYTRHSELWRGFVSPVPTLGGLLYLVAFYLVWINTLAFLVEKEAGKGSFQRRSQSRLISQVEKLVIRSFSLFLAGAASFLFFHLLSHMGWFLVYGDAGPPKLFGPIRFLATSGFFVYVCWYLYGSLNYLRAKSHPEQGT